MKIMSQDLGAAVGRSLVVWCVIASAAAAEDKMELHEDCVSCGTVGMCVPLSSLCDGSWDCPTGEDEDRQFCDVHLLRRKSRINDVEKNSARMKSRTPRPLIDDQPIDFRPQRTIRQMEDASSDSRSNSTDTPRSPIIVRTASSLNSTNTSYLIFIHLPDKEGNHPTFLPSLTQDPSLVSNATIVSRLNVNTRSSKPPSEYKRSHTIEECCGHCVRCASSNTCVAHTQLCDGQADCLQMEDEAPAFCHVFLQGRCPSGLAPCNGLCVPWALACAEHCEERPHFEACFAVRRKQLDISFLNKSTAASSSIRNPFAPFVNTSYAVLRPALPADPHPLTLDPVHLTRPALPADPHPLTLDPVHLTRPALPADSHPLTLDPVHLTRPALPADPHPLTLDPVHLTRPANSPFPNISTHVSKNPYPAYLHDKFIKVPIPSSQAENITSAYNSTYSSVIYKCSPISAKDRISSLLSANTLLRSPTKSSVINMNSEKMLMTPAETSNRNTFERLKTALANIHKNLLNLTKPVNESRASKFVPQKYPTITYHCVLVSKASDKELTAADFSKNDGNVQATNKDDVNHINSLDHSISPNNFINDTSTSNSELRNNQSSLIESGSNSQASSIREDSPAILQLNPHSPATTYKPPLTELMEKLVSPPPNQTPPSCPSLYTPVAHTCLTALPFSMTWQEAGDVCEKLGGQLAEARDITVLTAIARFLQRQGSRSNFWIGGFYDDITSAWMWRSSAKMKMSTPFWGYRHTEECSVLTSRSYSPASYPACTHYKQAPFNNTRGFCAALDTEFFYFITDAPCMHARKVLCSHSRIW